MKLSFVEKTLAFGLSAALMLGAAGCKSSGYDQGNQTAAQIQSAAGLIDTLSRKIDLTVASLNEMVDKPQADLRPQFKAYSANLDEMQAAARQIGDARRNMGAKGKAFFDEWDQQLAQIQNEDIKARSQSRKDEVSKKLMAIKQSYAEAETAFHPFLNDLKDVQNFLSIDLTPGGIAAAKEPAAKATREAAALKTSITKLAGEFKSLGVAMSSVTAAAASATPPPK